MIAENIFYWRITLSVWLASGSPMASVRPNSRINEGDALSQGSGAKPFNLDNLVFRLSAKNPAGENQSG